MCFGEIRDVSTDLAKDLIQAGYAEEIKEKESGNGNKNKSTKAVRSRK